MPKSLPLLATLLILIAASGCASVSQNQIRATSAPAAIPRTPSSPIVRNDRKPNAAPVTWIQSDGAEDPVRLDHLPLVEGVSAEPFSFLTPEFDGRPKMYAAGSQFVTDIFGDYGRFYSTETLLPLAAGLGIGAAIANTHADLGIRDFYQDQVRDLSTDEWSEMLHTPKILGNGAVTLPIFAAASITGRLLADQPDGGLLGEWGDRSLRTFLVGAPPMFALQYLTGGSRPNEIYEGSEWHPFTDNNGVSGHSFMGAIPFLSAAMMTDDPWLKAALYGASTMPGLSRINDDAHFASQVVLGWWLAYLAAAAVDGTQNENKSWRVVSLPARDGVMLGLEFRH